ncbi:hypothetical protein LPU83_3408 [Rhizobium favelukesii]|uniref:Uncharacterized protein n=2 Tax=Rhizobium/Agrobacterium group TaxID=227290 RepID=W6RCQ0_9HYPH|nr:hypothetical protein LPU83_3408 [Rhizobium favelukesii]
MLLAQSASAWRTTMTDTKTLLMAFCMTGLFSFLKLGRTAECLHEWTIFVGKLSFKIAGRIAGSR